MSRSAGRQLKEVGGHVLALQHLGKAEALLQHQGFTPQSAHCSDLSIRHGVTALHPCGDHHRARQLYHQTALTDIYWLIIRNVLYNLYMCVCV